VRFSKLRAGFSHQLLRLIAGGNVNGDGLIDFLDTVLALQMLSNFTVTGIQKDAYVNNYEAIVLREAIYPNGI